MDEGNVFWVHKEVQKSKDQTKAKISEKKCKDCSKYKSLIFKQRGHSLWGRPWEAKL